MIKVERPGGDSLRNMAWRDERDGEGLWWKLANRNKRTIVARPQGRRRPRARCCAWSTTPTCSSRTSGPGALERLGLGPDVLHARNPRLVVTRVTGFGQDGPYADRPGFATIAEAMSGFAAISGEPDGQPLLPPIALTDEVTGLAAAFATMVALHSGTGQVVDVNLLETMFHLMGRCPSLYALTRRAAAAARRRAAVHRAARHVPLRATASGSPCRRAATRSPARVMALLGVGDDERFTTFAGRAAHRDELEAVMTAWCARAHVDEALAAFTAAEAAAGPVMDMADIAADPHFARPRRRSPTSTARRCRR